MYILLSSVVIDILLTLTGQCSHTMLIIGTSPLLPKLKMTATGQLCNLCCRKNKLFQVRKYY